MEWLQLINVVPTGLIIVLMSKFYEHGKKLDELKYELEKNQLKNGCDMNLQFETLRLEIRENYVGKQACEKCKHYLHEKMKDVKNA